MTGVPIGSIFLGQDTSLVVHPVTQRIYAAESELGRAIHQAWQAMPVAERAVFHAVMSFGSPSDTEPLIERFSQQLFAALEKFHAN